MLLSRIPINGIHYHNEHLSRFTGINFGNNPGNLPTIKQYCNHCTSNYIPNPLNDTPLPDAIHDAMTRLNMSERELSRISGVPRPNLYTYIHGKSSPRLLTYNQIARALHLPVIFFMAVDPYTIRTRPVLDSYPYPHTTIPNKVTATALKYALKYAYSFSRIERLINAAGIALNTGIDPEILENLEDDNSPYPGITVVCKLADYFGWHKIINTKG